MFPTTSVTTKNDIKQEKGDFKNCLSGTTAKNVYFDVKGYKYNN